MRRPRRHANCLARMRQDRAAAEATDAKAHLTGDHGKLLFLDGMDVPSGYMRAGRQVEVKDEQLAAGLPAAYANDDALTADRIDDHAPLRLWLNVARRHMHCARCVLIVRHLAGQLPLSAPLVRYSRSIVCGDQALRNSCGPRPSAAFALDVRSRATPATKITNMTRW